jgi:hypothetical protein
VKDSWWNHNTDKVLLALIWLISDALVVYFVRIKILDHDIIIWALTSASNVLGAIVMILTGRANRADGQTGNGLPPSSSPTSLSINQVPPEHKP